VNRLKGKNLLIVTQEDVCVPSGVVTIVLEMAKKFSCSNKVTIYTNKQHWAQPFFEELLAIPGITVCRTNCFLYTDIKQKFYKIKNKLIAKLILKTITLILWPINILLVCKKINDNKFDTIISHNGGWPGGELNRLVTIAAKFTGVMSNVHVIHNIPYYTNKIFQNIFLINDLFVKHAATNIVTVSNSCAQSISLNSHLGNEIEVIYNGVADYNFSRSRVIDKRSRNHVPLIGFVGEIAPRKGVHLLISALQKIDVPWKLMLIGSGEDDYIKSIIPRVFLEKDRIQYVGFQKDVINYYESMDILVLPSVELESFGLVLIEAMRSEVPTVSSDFGGMREVVENEETGLIFSSGNAIELRDAIFTLLSQPKQRAILGKNGRERFLKKFSVDVMLKNYSQLIDKNSI